MSFQLLKKYLERSTRWS